MAAVTPARGFRRPEAWRRMQRACARGTPLLGDPCRIRQRAVRDAGWGLAAPGQPWGSPGSTCSLRRPSRAHCGAVLPAKPAKPSPIISSEFLRFVVLFCSPARHRITKRLATLRRISFLHPFAGFLASWPFPVGHLTGPDLTPFLYLPAAASTSTSTSTSATANKTHARFLRAGASTRQKSPDRAIHIHSQLCTTLTTTLYERYQRVTTTRQLPRPTTHDPRSTAHDPQHDLICAAVLIRKALPASYSC